MVLVALAAAPCAAEAQCAPPDLLASLPVDGAAGVPTDASLRARYAPTAGYLDEDVFLGVEGGEERSLEAVFDEAEGALVATPDAPLLPGTSYVVRWPGLRDRDGDVLGRGAVVTFETGSGPDRAAPTFEGARRLAWDPRKEHDDCTDSAEERYLFDLEAGASGDDTGPGTLEALVFQTRGPSMAPGDPPRLVLGAPLPETGENLRVRLPRSESLGEVCFALLARDLSGRVSESTPESCVRTDHPPFWRGCAAAPGSAEGGAWLLALLALAARRRSR